MTMTGANPATISIQDFYSRLAEIGLTPKFVRQFLLPEWWVRECESEVDAVVEAAAYVSRRTNLDFNSLIQGNTQPYFKNITQPCYKVRGGVDRCDRKSFALSQAIANRVAELIAYAWAGNPYDAGKLSGRQELRETILNHDRVVNLQSLTHFCLECGIAVVYVGKLPPGQKKFDGMVGFFSSSLGAAAPPRPVIMISKKHKSSAWLAFILAHELGHLIQGHVQDAPIIDEQINPIQDENDQEIEANEVALQLLFGKTNPCYFQLRNLTADKLADFSLQSSVSDHVDSGAIALNYAWYKTKIAADDKGRRITWATASKALNILEGNAHAPELINSSLSQYLELERLSDDNQEFLKLMIGV